MPFQDTLQHLVLSKVHTVLALNILVVYTTDRVSVSFFLILVQVWQLNNKVLRNIAWYNLINTCISHSYLNISLYI